MCKQKINYKILLAISAFFTIAILITIALLELFHDKTVETEIIRRMSLTPDNEEYWLPKNKK